MYVRIGLEIHIPLPTKTKLFCRCPTNIENKDPNKNVCPICMGLPGARPLINKSAIIYAIMIAKALNCKINTITHFSRKTYFYPDLPKNFQITQYELPIGENGYIKLLEPQKKVRIRRIHLEEDPGSIKYTRDGYTLVNYNRSGTPLVEVVTEPDLNNTDEVRMFLEMLISYLKWLELGDVEKNIRCDVNISVNSGSRVEIKNVSGINNIIKAADYEINKQKKFSNVGIYSKRETLMYDSKRGITLPLRFKEYEEDYGYIFEPDLPLFKIDQMSRNVHIPTLPDEKFLIFIKRYDIVEKQHKMRVRKIFFTSKIWSEILEKLSKDVGYSYKLLNIISHLMIHLDEKQGFTLMNNYYKDFTHIIKISLSEDLPYQQITDTIINLLKTGRVELTKIIENKKIIADAVDAYFRENPTILEDIKTNPKMINYVVGQIVKRTGLKYCAKMVYMMIKQRINTGK